MAEMHINERENRTGTGYHGLDVRDSDPCCLAGRDEHTGVIEIIALPTKPGYDGVADEGETGPLKQSAANKVSGMVIGGKPAFHADGEASGIGKAWDLESVQLVLPL